MALLTNIIAYYKLDENTGTSAVDSVSANNGTLKATTLPTWVTGLINSCLNMTNSDNNVEIVNNAALQNLTGLSVSAWLNMNTTPTYAARIHNFFGANHGWNWLINSNTTQVSFQMGNGVGTTTLNAGNLTVNSFTHVVSTWDGTTMRTYINGTVQATTTALSVANTGNPSANLIIGNSGATSGNRGFPGKIDELGIWSRALTQAEVTQLYNAGVGTQYPFSSIKTVLSLAKASVKTFLGLVNASLKTINGLS